MQDTKENVIIQNRLLKKDLQFRIATFSSKTYIFLFNFKKYHRKSKIEFFNQNM